MQAAFVTCDAYQCGYCTSGQIMSAVALLEGTVRTRGRGGAGVHEWQHLPLWRVSEHRGRDPKCAERRKGAEVGMKTFQLIRPKDSASSHRCDGEDENSTAGSGDSLHRGRDDADRFDEAKGGAAAESRRSQPAAARQDRSAARRRPNDWCHSSATPNSLTTRSCAKTTLFFPKRS